MARLAQALVDKRAEEGGATPADTSADAAVDTDSDSSADTSSADAAPADVQS
jgi:hypothetical protein